MSVQLHPDIETLDKESLCYSIYAQLYHNFFNAQQKKDDEHPYGIEEGDEIVVETAFGNGKERRLDKVIAVIYEIARGSVGAYYPEGNCLVPLDYIDPVSGTPSYKSIPDRISRAAA